MTRTLERVRVFSNSAWDYALVDLRTGVPIGQWMGPEAEMKATLACLYYHKGFEAAIDAVVALEAERGTRIMPVEPSSGDVRALTVREWQKEFQTPEDIFEKAAKKFNWTDTTRIDIGAYEHSIDEAEAP